MSAPQQPIDPLVAALRECAKELDCLYRIDEILSRRDAPEDDVYRAIVEALPTGWQYPDICRAKVTMGDTVYASEGFRETPWRQSAEIVLEGQYLGDITVYYDEEKPTEAEGPFLREERRLLNVIAEQVRHFVFQRRLQHSHEDLSRAFTEMSTRQTGDWGVIVQFLDRTDPNMLARITRRMINHLCFVGVSEAEHLLREVVADADEPRSPVQDNAPLRMLRAGAPSDLTERTFRIAAEHCVEGEIAALIQGWIEEEKSRFLVNTLENAHSGLDDIAEAVERFESANVDEAELPMAVRRSLRVLLLRRFFTDQLEFVPVAHDHVEVRDFAEILRHTIYPSGSHGRLGGKSAGLYLAARITARAPEANIRSVRTPKTWYVSSDVLLLFAHYNDLEYVYNQRYRSIDEVRQEYPHIVHVFKSSRMPPEIVKGLAVALDEFEDRPIIVRSSSLLEDRIGATFVGKYKSLFLANQGTKKERLTAVVDAIAEVYASVLGPDPIEYRAERGLLDLHEEMGIMIQEVVGRRVGRWFFPSFAGMAFSNNEFRWSPRIRREDGLLRIVPGLGTRAVDRVSDDYPVLLAPGQPGLRVNATPKEIVRYSPRSMDVIDLETNSFTTVNVRDVLRECGDDYPLARDIVSIVDEDRVRRPSGLEPNWEKDDFVVTFAGIVERTPFVSRIRSLMGLLREKLGAPVDIEFACDGEDLYLLQCRVQSHGEDHAPTPIPRDISRDRVLFSASRHVSNGRVPDITHVVYVVPEAYAALEDSRTIREVGRVVGRLNKLLPKRQFILIGPGRWGSRGDLRLGVPVTYADINNTSVLLEVARRMGQYEPDLSFGTHFFQDLVEADIRYLPLYPDEEGNIFREEFFLRARNLLPELVPEAVALAETIRVVDVAETANGCVLRLLMNADLDEAVAVLAEPGARESRPASISQGAIIASEEFSRWRLRMAEKIAAQVDPERFGVVAMYVFGSTKNATAGPRSDLDLIVHFRGEDAQRRDLLSWLEGWSRALAEVNFLRTGYASDGLLDVHLVTDDDIRRRDSYASKIGAITDAARLLVLGGG